MATRRTCLRQEPLDGVALGVAGRVVGPRHLRRGGITAQAPRAAKATSGLESSRSVTTNAGRGQGLRGVGALAGGQLATDQSSARIGGHVQLTGKAATAAPQGSRPIFCAPSRLLVRLHGG